jgi:hypothetical protein
MPRKPARSRIAAVLCLTATWSTACSLPPIHIEGGGDKGCAWAREIHTGPHVKAVIGRAIGAARAEGRLEDRDELRDFAKQVGDHNEKRREFCPAPPAAATPQRSTS